MSEVLAKYTIKQVDFIKMIIKEVNTVYWNNFTKEKGFINKVIYLDVHYDFYAFVFVI